MVLLLYILSVSSQTDNIFLKGCIGQKTDKSEGLEDIYVNQVNMPPVIGQKSGRKSSPFDIRSGLKVCLNTGNEESEQPGYDQYQGRTITQ